MELCDCTKMRDHIDSITDANRCLMRGISPSPGGRELATKIFTGVCGPYPVLERDSCHLCQSRNSPECCHENIELTCITLSLVEKMNSNLLSQSMPPETRLHFMEISRVLFEEMDFMSKLIHQFQAEDQFISHLAAKSVSTYIFYELQNSGTTNHTWRQKCVQAFQNPCSCNELDACMWSFTNVLKKILKGSHEEILERFLAPFDPHLSALCSKFLPVESEGEKQSAVYFTNTGDWGTTFSTLLDLMEILTAARLICRSGVCLHSPRLTSTHASALLKTISSPSDYFVKKRALLLLKRTLLQKAGEDMALGAVVAAVPRDKDFCADMTVLANSVLQAVSASWFQCVPVEPAASFFGGTSQHGEGGQKLDYVMLRAVSLVVVKSLEFQIQSAGGTEGVSTGIEVHEYLQALLGFLSQRGVPLKESSHLCSWYILVFGEQDDDMMEAAKAMLLLFLHYSLSSGSHAATASEAACASGSNPHCHFLLLLQSISFDHSTLLDFLISTETCFLEYFVRYLKHLRADWEGFSLACQRMETWGCHHLVHQWHPASCSSSSNSSNITSILTNKGEQETGSRPDLVLPSYCVQPTVCVPSVGISGLSLVDYGSSEESDTEDMEVAGHSRDAGEQNTGPGPTVSEEGTVHVIQGTIGLPASTVPTQAEHKPSYSPRIQTGSSPSPERKARGLCSTETQIAQTSRPRVPLSGQTPCPSCKTSKRTVLCLSELRQVLTRLRSKNLFPYNPSSLLKLLAQVETVSCSQH